MKLSPREVLYNLIMRAYCGSAPSLEYRRKYPNRQWQPGYIVETTSPEQREILTQLKSSDIIEVQQETIKKTRPRFTKRPW